MLKNMAWENEPLDEYSWRVKVFGGWIVYCQIESSLTSTYIQDTYHEWNVTVPRPELTLIENKVPECLL